MNVNASRLEDRLAPHEPKYKSRGEAQVGRLFDRYGIPFSYELPHLVYDRGYYRIWRPDFTLPTYKGLIVEYAGMPDIPDYMAGIRHKQRAYSANNKPALFIYPDDLRGSYWPERVVNWIVDASARYRSFAKYPARTTAQRSGMRPPRYCRSRSYSR